MNEELIRQCAREVVPFVDEPGTGEQNYRYAAAVMAIETYHARAVAPLVEALEGFVSDLTGGGKNREKWLSISHDALVARIQQARAALAPFQQEARAAALSALAEADGPHIGEVEPVSTEQAIQFLETATRNWGRVHFNQDGLEDFRIELERFKRKAVKEARDAAD